MEKKYAVGVDVGGSHISAVLFDVPKGKLLSETLSTRNVNKHGSANEILCNWKDAIQQAFNTIDPRQLIGIGFAMPGPFDYANGISLLDAQVDKYESLYKINVGQSLRELLKLDASTPFRFINDATAFAIGEAWIGKSAGFKRSIALTLGTGFGSAYIEDGVPVYEREDVATYGNFWHIPYKEGKADDYFSTRWFTRTYASLTGKNYTGVKEIADLADKDPRAKSLFTEFGSGLGEFLAPWISKFNAECLVIGGNLTGAMDLFGPPFFESFKRNTILTVVSVSELMETSALAGSARLLQPSFWQKIEPLYSKM
jgi:glucokinase